jgi:predicted  nucleic acid-binding Zn-ribbon protein
MNDATKAAKELKAFLGSLSHVQAALETLGKAERTEREIESSIETLQGEREKLDGKVTELRGSVRKLEERQGTLTKELEASAKESQAKAQDDALEMFRVTKAEAEKILSEARDRRKVVDADTELAKKALQDIRSKTNEARVELQTVRTELAKIKERIGA